MKKLRNARWEVDCTLSSVVNNERMRRVWEDGGCENVAVTLLRNKILKRIHNQESCHHTKVCKREHRLGCQNWLKNGCLCVTDLSWEGEVWHGRWIPNSSLQALPSNTSSKHPSPPHFIRKKSIFTVENTAARCSRHKINFQKEKQQRRGGSCLVKTVRHTHSRKTGSRKIKPTQINTCRNTHTHTHTVNATTSWFCHHCKCKFSKWQPEAKSHDTAPKSLNALISLSNKKKRKKK